MISTYFVEILPLVAFTIEEDISIEEAMHLIEIDTSMQNLQIDQDNKSQVMKMESFSSMKDVFASKSFEVHMRDYVINLLY